MNCDKCEHYSEVKISFLDSSDVETDMGIKRVECSEKKRILIGKATVGLGNYTYQKSNSTTTIGIISVAECPDNLKHLLPKTYYNDVPEWCPKKKKKKK